MLSNIHPYTDPNNRDQIGFFNNFTSYPTVGIDTGYWRIPDAG
jgi:hypothetical protein